MATFFVTSILFIHVAEINCETKTKFMVTTLAITLRLGINEKPSNVTTASAARFSQFLSSSH